MKPGTAPSHSVRLMDQVRERVRYLHYSLSTEKTYLYWIRFFIRWQAMGGQMRHPRDMGAAEVEAFLTMLATERKVSASTHNQALSALLFLYREVLCITLPWLENVNRPAQKRRIPSASPYQYTRCDTALQRICCSRGPIFAQCRSCWATAMSAPP